MVNLLSGGTDKLEKLFNKKAYGDIGSVSLAMDEENFYRVLSELEEEDAELLKSMRDLYDCALLNVTLDGKSCISEAKIAIYRQHGEDLKTLKYFVRKYRRESYARVFRDVSEKNYTAYSGNTKSCKDTAKFKRIGKADFCDFIRKSIVHGIEPEEEDRAKYEDMIERLTSYTFLPKQKEPDNRVIPHQLYEQELQKILARAKRYLPWLENADEDGITNEKKSSRYFNSAFPTLSDR